MIMVLLAFAAGFILGMAFAFVLYCAGVYADW